MTGLVMLVPTRGARWGLPYMGGKGGYAGRMNCAVFTNIMPRPIGTRMSGSVIRLYPDQVSRAPMNIRATLATAMVGST